jgi:hypothetical protein
VLSDFYCLLKRFFPDAKPSLTTSFQFDKLHRQWFSIFWVLRVRVNWLFWMLNMYKGPEDLHKHFLRDHGTSFLFRGIGKHQSSNYLIPITTIKYWKDWFIMYVDIRKYSKTIRFWKSFDSIYFPFYQRSKLKAKKGVRLIFFGLGFEAKRQKNLKLPNAAGPRRLGNLISVVIVNLISLNAGRVR